MKRIGLLVVVLAAIAGGVVWLVPDAADAIQDMFATAPSRAAGPGIVVTCDGEAGGGGYIGIGQSTPGPAANTRTEQATLQFVRAHASPADVCGAILEAAQKRHLRAVRERRRVVVIYGSDIGVFNPTITTVSFTKF